MSRNQQLAGDTIVKSTGTNNKIPAWTTPAYKPDCAGCHANDFKPGLHKKYENPSESYSISEHRDCSGACHIYTNSLPTTIKDYRRGEHQTTAGGF
jgi:hypothetical protein